MAAVEKPEARALRERQRVLFDGVADLYAESRQLYPAAIVQWMAETARLAGGARVLEIGCGTGQLTRQLAQLPIQLTAIDLGSAMVERARVEVRDPAVRFDACSFEDFEASPRSFDLIVCGTAFHWLDPLVAWSKAADLLAPGGWLAILFVGERYDEPLRSRIRSAWSSRTPGRSDARSPTWADRMAAAGLFTDIKECSDEQRVSLAPQTVLGVERTRATYLSFNEPTQRSFADELERALDGCTGVPTVIETVATMGRVDKIAAIKP